MTLLARLHYCVRVTGSPLVRGLRRHAVRLLRAARVQVLVLCSAHGGIAVPATRWLPPRLLNALRRMLRLLLATAMPRLRPRTPLHA